MNIKTVKKNLTGSDPITVGCFLNPKLGFSEILDLGLQTQSDPNETQLLDLDMTKLPKDGFGSD